MADILIKNGFIATMDSERRVYPTGDLYIDDDRIVSVGDEVEVTRSPEYVIDAEHKVVLPGFVNVHGFLNVIVLSVSSLILVVQIPQPFSQS